MKKSELVLVIVFVAAVTALIFSGNLGVQAQGELGIMGTNGSAVDNSGNVYQCGDINQSGTYVLNQSITTAGSCINITADNVTLNGNGFIVDGDDSGSDYGVYASERLNVTVKNFLNITDFYRGIYFTGTNNSLITNITSDSNTNYGIYLESSSNNILINITSQNINGIILNLSSNNNQLTNIIMQSNSNGVFFVSSSYNNLTNITNLYGANGIKLYLSSNNILINVDIRNAQEGVYFDSSSNNQFTNITANSNSNRGIALYPGSNNNTFTNINANLNTLFGIEIYPGSSYNQFTNLTANNNIGAGLNILGADNNTFIHGIITNSTNADYAGIYFEDYFDPSLNNLFQDFIINNTNAYNVLLGTGVNNNNTFLNVSYIGTNQSELVTGGELIRKWYVDLTANNSLTGLVNGANISIYNVTSALLFNGLTSASGTITQQQATEYLRNSTNIYYATPHTINATKTGYQANSTITNLSSYTNSNGNKNIILFMDDTQAPEVIALTESTTFTSLPFNISYSATDNVAIANCTLFLNTGVNYTNESEVTAETNKFNISSLDNGNYNYTVNCTDTAGNTGNSSTINFIMAIPAAAAAGSSGGGGGGGGSAALQTYTISENQLVGGYNQNLGAGDKIKFNFSELNESHILTLKSVSLASANIEIQSNTISVALNIGEQKKVDLNSDSYYDLNLKLNSIVNSKANLTVKLINESYGGAVGGVSEDVGNASSSGEKENTLNFIKNNILLYVIIGVVVLVIATVIILYFALRNKKRKR